MLSIKRHLGERLVVGDRYQITVLELLHDGVHRPGARLSVQTRDTRLELWLYKGDRLSFDGGALIVELGKIGVGRVRLQVVADGLAIEWPKSPAAANGLSRILSTIYAARMGGAL